MARKISRSSKRLSKFFLRCLGIGLILVILFLSPINPTPVSIYGATFIVSFLVIFLVLSSYNLRSSYARQIGQHTIAKDLEESIKGQVDLYDKVKKGGRIHIISGSLNPIFYDRPEIRNKFEQIVREKHPEIIIKHGPTNNHDFINWARELGVKVIALGRIPKKHLTCVDEKHVRWETDLLERRNHIFHDCQYYGKRCEILFQKYLPEEET